MTKFPQLNTEELNVDITLHTNKGDIDLALFPEVAPKTVENFKELSKKGITTELSSTVLLKTS